MLSSATLLAGEPDPADAVQFDRDIRPILSDICFNCHGPDGRKRKAKLYLGDRKSAFAVRDGIAAVVPWR